MEFLLIESLGPDGFGVWFLTLAAIFAAMTWASQVTLRRARLDGDNDAFFASREPATLRDFVPSAIIVTALALAGIALLVSDHQGWFAALAMVGATAVLGLQTYLSDVFWRRSVQPESSEGA